MPAGKVGRLSIFYPDFSREAYLVYLKIKIKHHSGGYRQLKRLFCLDIKSFYIIFFHKIKHQ
jgi:hypothetical protein